MVERARCRTLLVLLPLALGAGACGASIQNQARKSAASTPLPAVPTAGDARVRAPEDPVTVLIAESERHFTAGQEALELGHLEAAKREFNRAIDLLLESPYGGRTEPRIREHFDRLVDRISAYEVQALVEGDGFTEQASEPASIDDLLAMSTTFDHTAPAELQDTVESDLEAGVHDIPIPLNPRVLSYIDLFQGRLHDFIQEGLQRGSRYLPMIQHVFHAEGLPLDLAYVPLVESAFKPTALSHAKAKGVWQFMTGTAVENGLRHDWYIDERSDPEKATEAAAKYLKTLHDLFKGDWHLALASYNGGPGRLQRAIKRIGVDDFWKLAARPRLLPRETREYVPMILAAIVIARNPAQYGFDFTPDPPDPYDTVTLSRPVDLRHIAEWSGTTIDEIQSLNPELRRWTTPVRDTDYELRVPAGTAGLVEARMVETPAADLASLKYYTVKRGDTLLRIARTLHVNRTDLAEANYLRRTARVRAGQKLIVPHEATALMAAHTNRKVPMLAEASLPAGRPAVVAAAMDRSDGRDLSSRVKTTYRVRRGDTLTSIARRFKTTIDSLKTWNQMRDDGLIAGERLTVYARAN